MSRFLDGQRPHRQGRASGRPHDSAGKDYFVREVAYGAFHRSFALPEGVDATHVEAKFTNGMLEVRVPAPRAATPRMIEVKAA